MNRRRLLQQCSRAVRTGGPRRASDPGSVGSWVVPTIKAVEAVLDAQRLVDWTEKSHARVTWPDVVSHG